MRTHKRALIDFIDPEGDCADDCLGMLECVLVALLQRVVELYDLFSMSMSTFSHDRRSNTQDSQSAPDTPPFKTIVDVHVKSVRATVIAPPSVVHEHLVSFPHHDPLVIWMITGRLEHHASLVFSFETSLIPVTEVFVSFGICA